MRRWANAGLLLAHRLQRWPNSKPTLTQRLIFAGVFPVTPAVHMEGGGLCWGGGARGRGIKAAANEVITIYTAVLIIREFMQLTCSYPVPVSSEIRHGVDIRHGLNSYSLRMTVCNAYG